MGIPILSWELHQKKIHDATLLYAQGEKGEQKTAVLTFTEKSGIIRSLIMTFPDEPIETIVPTTLRIINPILDGISLQKKIPVKICRIDLYHASSSFLISTYKTIPYTVNYNLEENDINYAIGFPDGLKSVIQLYREAKNSSSNQYRFLCLFKACETLIEIRTKNSLKAKKNVQDLSRAKIVVPDNDVMRTFFNDYIGDNFDGVINKLRKKYRDSIAHLNFDENERIRLDPGEAMINHKIEAAIELLDNMLHQAIEIEKDFIVSRGL